MPTPPHRILALDPGTREMGVVVLEGTGLLYYGVCDFTHRRRPADVLFRATRATITRFISRYEPTVLAYEQTFYIQAKQSALLHVQELEIERIGRAHGLRVRGCSPFTVRSRLCGDGRATKEDVADRLVERYPELARYRFRPGSARNDYWLNMFDALAVAVVCQERPGAVGAA
jgi:Holliday junction resolvasome RuvABC endonuclease subunit